MVYSLLPVNIRGNKRRFRVSKFKVSGGVRHSVLGFLPGQWHETNLHGSPRNLGYEIGGGQGFYSWIACNESDNSGISTCDRDKPPSAAARWPKTEGGQSLIDSQDLFPQALAATLGVGGEAARKRLQTMIALGRHAGMVRNNLVPQERIDPRIVSSADKWSPVDAKGFCKPAANGSMVYAGHCVCSNETSAVGTTCWGNFGNNQQNGGRVFSTLATVFESGPYLESFADFKLNVENLRLIAKQLNAKAYGTPLLSSDRNYLRKQVTSKVILDMCHEMHHLSGPQPKDDFGEELCSHYKDVTYGLRTGPRGMLLGFAVGTLGIKVSAAGMLSAYGTELSAASPRKTIALPAWVKTQWPAELKGAHVGGMTVKGVAGVSLSCNITVTMDSMDCVADFPVHQRLRLKSDDNNPTASRWCSKEWIPPSSALVPNAPNVMLIGDSISKGNSGYSLYVRDILQNVLPSGLRGDATSLVATLQHGGGFGSDGQAAASKDGVAKVSCYDGNATGTLRPKAWSVLSYNAGLHDCDRGEYEWVNATAYEANLRGIFSVLKSAASAVLFVATTPFDLKLPINYTHGITPQCVIERNDIAKRVAAEMGVGYNDVYSFVNEGCLGVNYTECAWQTTGLHFFTRAPLPSGQQYTAISVANSVIRSLDLGTRIWGQNRFSAPGKE